MTRSITGRGAWNAANARLANKPFDDLFAPISPGRIKLLYCCDCKTYTNHQKLKSGEWICWCARVEPVITDGTDTNMLAQLQESGHGSGGVM